MTVIVENNGRKQSDSDDGTVRSRLRCHLSWDYITIRVLKSKKPAVNSKPTVDRSLDPSSPRNIRQNVPQAMEMSGMNKINAGVSHSIENGLRTERRLNERNSYIHRILVRYWM